jgi:hypothetical protein
LDTTPTEILFNCHEFETSDCWHYLTQEEYIENTLENFCEDTDFSASEPKQFDIFKKQADDYVGHYDQSEAKTNHCIVLKQ